MVLTASQIDRLMACPAGVLLPGVSDPGEASARGTEVHGLRLTPETFPEEFRDWFGGVPDFEAAYVWQPGSPGRFLGFGLGRRYPDNDAAMLAGTADAISPPIGGPRSFRLADLKTGRLQLWGGSLPPPGSSWQLRTLSVLWWVRAGMPEDVEGRLAWLLWDEDREEGWVEEASDPVRVHHLRSWLADLVRLLRRADSGEARSEFARGPWCLSCSSFDFCPAQKGAISRVSDVAPTEASLSSVPDEALARLWLDLRASREQTERAEEALLRLLVRKEAGIALSERRELAAETSAPRRVKAPDAVLKAAEARYGSKAPPAMSEAKVTLSSIRRGLVRIGKLDEEDDFLAELEELGAVTRNSPSPRLAERRRRTSGG